MTFQIWGGFYYIWHIVMPIVYVALPSKDEKEAKPKDDKPKSE